MSHEDDWKQFKKSLKHTMPFTQEEFDKRQNDPVITDEQLEADYLAKLDQLEKLYKKCDDIIWYPSGPLTDEECMKAGGQPPMIVISDGEGGASEVATFEHEVERDFVIALFNFFPMLLMSARNIVALEKKYKELLEKTTCDCGAERTQGYCSGNCDRDD